MAKREDKIKFKVLINFFDKSNVKSCQKIPSRSTGQPRSQDVLSLTKYAKEVECGACEKMFITAAIIILERYILASMNGLVNSVTLDVIHWKYS